ncbi:carotenoid oxygenase family protein [Mycolicibacterium monacense]|uniref:Dioxygenase n=3 Tax=Mycobacteriaceae TaxID=1762 RepID=A0AAD1MZ19_MYCMB|nr:carotenoid oxygenase family protein [Mycolicibacterium monacense]MDA4102054.1 apocarotenoid-15,15'-oxygenase [Mycolicibacterium monacense DSM 44395]OBB74886.1 apocarotenoid-15,15'-oxygenase [Mycolicibacterium monacense]ORB20027.1 apocarotenoid-15,15'-oxygenase [Mycolicibacterium monacense DSM 44395]QHP86797.1 apocarotenoid-15,15'-oxygenase [Mycolicibacterium monacense DSM 44395]BBZ60130.1 apocarotenoid-15,15'-oxygenase [Mycolicibacterium monacense]
MRVERLQTFASTLPADDDHPYRTGPWRPQVTEWRADDLEVVAGEVPADLDGMYLRNTENPLHPAATAYHPFDGDGMIHIVEFGGGKAAYRNRFVRTDGFLAENEAGGPLWAGFIEMPSAAKRADGWGARTRMKDASSTDVVVHRGTALTSFYMCGDLYQVDPYTADTLGKETWHGDFPDWGVSAHPKIDPVTGELLFFSYSKEAPHLRYGVVDKDANLVHHTDVALPGPRMPHDMAFTENYVILNDFPLFWEPSLLKQDIHAPVFHRDMPSRFAVLPRRGDQSQVRWFETDPTYALHFVNAYEDGDEIVLDGFFQDNPSPSTKGAKSLEDAAFRYLALDGFESHLHRWRFNLATGAATEERLSDSLTEFGMMNGDYQTRRHRYVYAATGKPGWFLFDGLVKHDLRDGTEERITFGDGVFGSETAMAPRQDGTAEDDGYLVTLTTDMNDDASYCLVFDAARIADGPVCKLRLPERICSGTHSTWVSGAELRRWHSPR